MRLATSVETGAAARAVVAWRTNANNADTATSAIAGRRSEGCVGNTVWPLSFGAYGVSWRARAERDALSLGRTRPFAPTTWVPRSSLPTRTRRCAGAEYPIVRRAEFRHSSTPAAFALLAGSPAGGVQKALDRGCPRGAQCPRSKPAQ